MTHCNDRIVSRAMFDEAMRRGDEAEARVVELEEAIGVMVPTIIQCFLNGLGPDAGVDRAAGEATLARVNKAMAKRRAAPKVQA